MSKRSSGQNLSGTRKCRKIIGLQEKLEIIQHHDRGDSTSVIARHFGHNESTIRTILCKSKEYQEMGRAAPYAASVRSTRNRSCLMIEMERLLSIWIKDCNQKSVPISTPIIKEKALELFSSLKEKDAKYKTEKFIASSGWFDRFRKRLSLHNAHIKGEAASANEEVANRFPETLKKIIEDLSTGEKSISVPELWRNYNIRNAIENIRTSWMEVTESNMRAVLDRILPICVKTQIDNVNEIKKAGKNLGFEGLDKGNVNELLNSRLEELNEDDLLGIDARRVCEKSEEETPNPSLKEEITQNNFSQIFETLERLKEQCLEADSDADRSAQVCRNLDSALLPYLEIYRK